MFKVIFACIHNAGRSQMAAAFFNQLADPAKAQAVSAGTEPGTRVHPEVQAMMQEVGIDLSQAKPQKLTEDLARDAQLLVTMGCGDQCPYVPGLRRDDWPLGRRYCAETDPQYPVAGKKSPPGVTAGYNQSNYYSIKNGCVLFNACQFKNRQAV